MLLYSNTRVVRNKLPLPTTKSEYDAYYSYYYLRNVSPEFIGYHIKLDGFKDWESRIVCRFIEEDYIDFSSLKHIYLSMKAELNRQGRLFGELDPDNTYVYISNTEQRPDSSLLFSVENADEFERTAKLISSVVGPEYKYSIFRVDYDKE